MKKHLHISRNSIGTSIAVILVALNVIHGCTKETSVHPGLITDKNFFFTVNMGEKSYTTYRVYSEYYPDLINSAPGIWGVYKNQSDPSGGPLHWDLHINVLAPDGNNHKPLPESCSASISLKKKGDFFGIYEATDSSVFNNPMYSYKNSIYDIDGKAYIMELKDAVFDITSMSPPATTIPYVDGTFHCNVYEATGSHGNLVPVSGSFRLKIFW